MKLDVLRPSINTDVGKVVASAVLAAAHDAAPDRGDNSGRVKAAGTIAFTCLP